MRILVLGGTGMLGYSIVLEALKQGHIVEATARTKPRYASEFDEHVKLHQIDMFTCSDAGLMNFMQGFDALVYALGPDDRLELDEPAHGFFQRYLVQQTYRILNAARQAGVRRTVVCGSYFASFARRHPDWQLAEHHPYIRARLDQALRAVDAGEDHDGHGAMDVMIIEIPYTFGTTLGRESFWKEYLFEIVHKWNPVFFPKGGTAVTTTGQIAQATIGALQRGEHGQAYAISERNMDWNEMLSIIAQALGQNKPIVNIPRFVARYVGKQRLNKLQRAKKYTGLEPLHISDDVLYRYLYLNPSDSRAALGYGPTDVPQAIRETVWASYPELKA